MGVRKNLSYDWLAFFMGLVSNLFINTPGGRMAMLDLASLFIAPILFMVSFSTYTKYLKRLMLLIVLWLLNAIISDQWRGTPLLIGFKAWMIIFNSLTLAIVAAWMLRKSVRALPFFLVGCAISTVIQLYYFQNGALLSFAIRNGFEGRGAMGDYLIDKQVYPLWVAMFAAIMMTLRIVGVIPWPICIFAYFSAAIFLMAYGGSRASFLIYTCTGFLIYAYVYWRSAFKFFFKRKFLTFCGIVLVAILFNEFYMFAAKAGWLGAAGYAKVEAMKTGESTFMDDRADILYNSLFLLHSPIIGAGSEFIDRWGYVDRAPLVPHYDANGHHLHYECLYGHSCLVGAWTGNGIFGLLFWVYVLWLLFDFLGEKLYVLKDAGPFVMSVLISLCWKIAFSPYGMFRAMAMFMAVFLAMIKDPTFSAWIEGRRAGNVNRRRVYLR